MRAKPAGFEVMEKSLERRGRDRLRGDHRE
jgi:hypothetical protein